MIRAFLVDDEPPARARLRQLLADAGDVLVVGEAGDVIEARTAIAETHPDVIFLDVEMPQSPGTALAATLPEPRPFVVFATAFDRYALDAFSVDATDYLLKPITRARLTGTLNRLRERLGRQSDLEREMKAASAAQSELLPRHLPAIPGFDCAAITLPARAVGGDFYLAQSLANGRFALALGDVAGKGVPAGLVASSVQARLETLAHHPERSAAAVVADVNRALAAALESARFTTLAYLEIDPVAGAIAVVNAGHPSLIAVGADGSRELIPSSGPALGLLPDARFEAAEIALAPGGVLVAYSDGVTEAFDSGGEELGEARLAVEIERRRSASAGDLCRHLLDLVRDHRDGTPATDDVTVLVVRRI